MGWWRSALLSRGTPTSKHHKTRLPFGFALSFSQFFGKCRFKFLSFSVFHIQYSQRSQGLLTLSILTNSPESTLTKFPCFHVQNMCCRSATSYKQKQTQKNNTASVCVCVGGKILVTGKPLFFLEGVSLQRSHKPVRSLVQSYCSRKQLSSEPGPAAEQAGSTGGIYFMAVQIKIPTIKDAFQ